MLITSTTGTLIRALLTYRARMPIVVIQVNDVANAMEIRELNDILNDLFLIVVAENNEEKVMRLCRDLYPRLLIHDKNDLGVFAAVIERRLAEAEHQRDGRTARRAYH